MQNIITVAERHGLLIVFLNVLLSQGGLPLPVVPTLMTVAALARQSPYQITQIILAGVSGALIADAALYWCGRRLSRPSRNWIVFTNKMVAAAIIYPSASHGSDHSC